MYSVTEDNSGKIWIATGYQGIYYWDGDSTYQLDRANGLRTLEITGIVSNPAGDVLILHNHGIDLLDPDNGHLIYFDKELEGVNFQVNIQSFCLDDKGNIWIGLTNDLIRFTSPGPEHRIHPSTIIQHLFVNADTIDFKSINEFTYNDNYIGIEYAGLWYTKPEAVSYRYRLVGLEDEWEYTDNNRVIYHNLNPGEYHFEVQSTENEGFLDEPLESYSFTILPPFYARPWFIILVFLLIVGAIYNYTKWNEQRVKRQQSRLREKIESELRILRSQINPHFLFNSFNTLISLIEDDSESALEFAEQLSDFYRSIIKFRNMDLITLGEEIEVLKNYMALIKKRFGESIRMDIDIDGYDEYLIPPLTLQLLFENAVKHNAHSPADPLQFQVTIKDDHIVVQNNVREKRGLEPSTGYGLDSIRRRYQLLYDKEVRVDKPNGHFRVSIPLIKEEAI